MIYELVGCCWQLCLVKVTLDKIAGIFRSNSFFMAANVRKAVAEGRADATPIFLQDIPKLFHNKIIKPDVAMVHVSLG